MKSDSLVILAAAAVAAVVVVRMVKKGPATREVTPGGIMPGAAGYGWRYFTDGVAIGPDGTYYKDGAPVWAPTGIAGDEIWSVAR